MRHDSRPREKLQIAPAGADVEPGSTKVFAGGLRPEQLTASALHSISEGFIVSALGCGASFTLLAPQPLDSRDETGRPRAADSEPRAGNGPRRAGRRRKVARRKKT